jgi:hypothetical protein
LRVDLGVELTLIVIQVGVDVDEVDVFEPFLGAGSSSRRPRIAWA